MTFGGIAADIQGVGERYIVVKTPPHPEGRVDVVVTNPEGTRATLTGGFTYRAASSTGESNPVEPIAVVAVSPSTGSAGAILTINGTGFEAGAGVTLGGVPATVLGINTTRIWAIAPAHAPGQVDVVVTNPGGQAATLTGAFTYLGPTVLSVSPIMGSPNTLLTITGSGFQPGAVVTLGGIFAPVLSTITTRILAVAPAHAPGQVDVVVTNPGGQAATLTGAFTYRSPPTVVLTVTPNTVAPGSSVSVNWTASNGGMWDWIGLFKVGEPNESYLDYRYTSGVTSGMETFAAPDEPGQYEFRYLPDDDYIDVARSGPVTVTAGPPGAEGSTRAAIRSGRDPGRKPRGGGPGR